MGTQYSQLSIEERCELARLHTAGHSYRQIAAALDRAPSTIMREVKRNGSRTQGYQAGYADEQAWARRWVGGKLERDAALRKTVLEYLQCGWSPEQVAGHMARDAGGPAISHETIYRFIYGQVARTKDYSGTTCREARRNGDPIGAVGAVRPPSLPSAVHWRHVPRRRPTAKPPATGRLT